MISPILRATQVAIFAAAGAPTADAQVIYAVEQNGASAAATCLPSPLLPNTGRQATGPLQLAGPGQVSPSFTLQATDGCAGGIAIAEGARGALGPRVFWTDGTTIFSARHPIYAALTPSAAPGNPPPATPIGALAVDEDATRLYWVAGLQLFVFNVSAARVEAALPMDGWVMEFFDADDCITGMTYDKCSRSLFATNRQGIIVNFTELGVPVGVGLVGQVAGVTPGSLITGLAIDHSAPINAPNSTYPPCTTTQLCTAYVPRGLIALDARDPFTAGDARLLSFGPLGIQAFGASANEATGLPVGLAVSADAQHRDSVRPAGAIGPSVSLSAPMTVRNVASPGVTLTYTASVGTQQLAVAGQVG